MKRLLLSRGRVTHTRAVGRNSLRSTGFRGTTVPAFWLSKHRRFLTASRTGVGRSPWLSSMQSTRSFSQEPGMFCFQCEQTEGGKGCTTLGVCGKTPETAALQDLLVHLCKGIAQYARRARDLGAKDAEIDRFVLAALFSTLTNVNFDSHRFIEYIKQADQHRATARSLYEGACAAAGTQPEHLSGPAILALPQDQSLASLEALGRTVGVLSRQEQHGTDLNGVMEMTMYGLKGASAYAQHALMLGEEADAVYKTTHEVLDALSSEAPQLDDMLGLALRVGEHNLQILSMLDTGHNSRFGGNATHSLAGTDVETGAPEPTSVPTRPREGKALLVSGHDLCDLESILKQTTGTGVNVYTHGEMLPGHAYPRLKAFPHLAGHYGGPWQLQKFEFGSFPGSIVMTTNCIIEPLNSYKHRIFTRTVTGWPGVTHLEGNDFSAAINAALAEDGFDADDVSSFSDSYLTTGFGHSAVLGVADKIVEAVKAGHISRFAVIGGCDGSEGERSYFTDVAEGLPRDTVILTLGCGKYRVNRLELGDIGGIPRVLDMGQCNDAYSAIKVASALADAFKTDVNGLPLSFAISWFEQKAVAVLLTLLHLGIKDIRLGPNLPGFATPAMVDILNQKFNLQPIGTPEADIKAFMAGK